jgi:hypothetical protein
MQVGMDPRAVLVIDGLRDAVRFLPVPLCIVPEGGERGRTSVRGTGIPEAGAEVFESHQLAR